MTVATRRCGDAQGWVVAVLFAVAVLLFAQGCASWWPRTVDDAFIIFQYARNLAEGVGPVYFAGEHVEGYTSPAWMVLMATAIAAGLDPVPVSKWLGAAASLALLPLMYLGLRRSDLSNRGAVLAVTLVASSFVLQIWSVAGLETNLYALLFFAGLICLATGGPSTRSAAFASVLLVAAALTRPEGLLFWGLGLIVVLARPGESRTGVRWRRAGAYLLPGLVLLAHLLWRWSYYGDPLPNTYYAKTGGGAALWKQGYHGLEIFVFASGHWIWLAGAAAGAISGFRTARRRRGVVIMAGAVILHLLYVVSVGDDGLRIHRFYVPILAPLAVLVAHLFLRDAGSQRARKLLAGIGVSVVLLAVALSIWKLHVDLLPRMRDSSLRYQQGNVKLGRHLGRTRDPGTLIAVAAAGAIPYYSRLPTIDMYGLNERRIARGPFPDGRGRLMKWDNEHVLSRAPELIVINRGYVPAGDPRAEQVRRDPGILAAAPMDRDLFRRIARSRAYRLVALQLEDGSLFYVFERGA